VETREPREEFKKLEDCGFGESGLVPSVDGLWERKELEGGEVENSRQDLIVANLKKRLSLLYFLLTSLSSVALEILLGMKGKRRAVNKKCTTEGPKQSALVIRNEL